MRSFRPLPSLVLTFLLFGSVCLSAQTGVEGPARQFSGERMTVNVDIVDVYFIVEQNHRFVENLKKEEFTLLEGNEKQQIRYFSAESEVPLSLGMLIDTSTSELPALNREHEVARRFLDTVLVPGDEGLVVSFDSHIQLRQDFTSDHGLLVDAIGQSQPNSSHKTPEIEPEYKRGMHTSTALYDAIVGIANHRFAARAGRKAMIIITDGEDIGSRANANQSIEAALKSNAICYVLLVGDPRYMSTRSYLGYEKMQYLAEQTGGRVLRIDKKAKNLAPSLQAIAAELRHHYSIGYTPTNRRPSAEYRKISIRSRRGYQVKSRRGYYYLPKSSERGDGE